MNSTAKTATRVLVIEDEPLEAERLALMLRQCGYDVVGCCATGADALKTAREIPPDVVITDIVLLGESDATRAATEIADRYDAAIIYLTAHTDEEQFLRARRTEPDAYLVKPYDARQLELTIENSLHGRQMQRKRMRRETADRAQLDAHLQLLSLVTDRTDNGIAVADTDGRIQWCNPAFCRLTGLDERQMLERPLADVLKRCDARGMADIGSPLADDHTFGLLLERSPDGTTTRWVACDVEYVDDPEEDGGKYIAILRDITRRKEAENQLHESESMFRALVEQSLVGVFIAERGTFRYVNPRLANILGYSVEELTGGIALEQLVHEDDRPMLAARLQRRLTGEHAADTSVYRVIRGDGGEIVLEVLGTPAYHHGESVVFGMAQDITERRRNASEVERFAFYDSLTGLPNRRRLSAAAALVLQQAKRNGTEAAIMQLDLERFRDINDTLGHAVGDLLLSSVAQRLQSAAPAGAVAARLGNDQFALVMPGAAATEVEGRAYQILNAINEPHQLDNHQVRINARAGLALYPRHGDSLAELLQRADLALNDAKERRSTLEHFSPGVERAVRERVSLERHLIEALDGNQLQVYFQPRIELLTGEVAGLEALVRWPHPQLGLITPDRFIPLAEHTGLIHRLGAWVLENACQHARHWRDRGHNVRLAVNLSTRELEREGIVDQVGTTLRRWGLPPSALEIEITESTALSGKTGVNALSQLKALGVHLAIDDFGTGYSSLSQLRLLEPAYLKIDKSFVMALGETPSSAPSDARIIEGTVRLAHSLRIRTVGEGVETRAQLRFLQSLGCEEAQGYLFARPAPAKEIIKLLRRGRWANVANGSV